MQLYQKNEGYRYNSDTLLLYDFISFFKPKGKILDVGSGCGILGLLIKRDFLHVELSQIDIQEINCTLTRKNAQYNKLDSKVICEDIIKSNFESNFDFIISNPPFYHKGTQKSENKSLSISRHSDYLPFDDFAKKVSKILNFRGSFIFCYDAKQIDTLLACLLKYNLKVNDIKFIYPKQDKEASLVIIHAKKGSKSICKVLPPFYMYEKDGSLSLHVNKINQKSKTKSLIWED